MSTTTSIADQRYYLDINHINGFEEEQPDGLKGLIESFDYQLLMFKLNHVIKAYKQQCIQLLAGTVIAIIPFVIFLIIQNRTQMIIASAGLTLNFVGGIGMIIYKNKQIRKSVEDDLLKFTNRYLAQGISFTLEKYPEPKSLFWETVIHIHSTRINITVQKQSNSLRSSLSLSSSSGIKRSGGNNSGNEAIIDVHELSSPYTSIQTSNDKLSLLS
ncbi:hypothetical protein DFA_00530 [Cavenderia fasciculata]|uniref:Transmembrane protein n=1 Tax=Cavenderia fasciculata TaxID=261658 RepID=F4PSC3_CACFS|nr:uncharacterized protein DFA_00530 [Cavenderia fasciculata]EGG20669.1 hypothetical protein DFA_00530 [Cavenderia fasciculata]|eukprot:XP_004358519.1 hypothetical protein DFA_00530 [Cavenderia fasciculata]